ncbi:hypothetical protein [Falsiroseomonas tokyonensis]|uniref:Uncharacterized protein n=1 Tax=Falsiroseomonas tokyonensis TaxID=430521 RepID=A0ABV7C2J2_9PROT|nr:hypothetical protein [Falsiroseomonas tokyonensis]MBU8542035.1 hypothetical protein [Falsiroseomonas tokyonensis]
MDQMTTTTTTTTTTEATTAPRSLAERARDAFLAAQQRVHDFRLARARGDAGAPSAAALAKAREELELAEDRAKLAEEAARAHAAAEERRRQVDAIHARRAELEQVYSEHLAAGERLVRASEEMAAAMGAYADLSRDLAQREPSTAGIWQAGRMDGAMQTLTGAWPQHLPIPQQRPIPFRDAATRAAWPAQQDRFLRERLPMPALPEPHPDDAHAAAAA